MNLVTDKIPSDICSVLMDLAQAHSGKFEMDYSDIMSWSDKATKDDIVFVRGLIADLADLDFQFEDDEDASDIADNIINTIKG
jgi:hypothetical protein